MQRGRGSPKRGGDAQKVSNAIAVTALGIPPPRRISGAITHDLGVAIMSGRYKPGDMLPNEVDFSEQLEVSRSAYREAVRTLIAKGLVESRPKTGTRVSAREQWRLLDPEVLAWSFASEPDDRFISNLFELRAVVEPAAAAMAAERRTGAQLAGMGHSLEEMARHGLATTTGQAADQRFHRLILEASGNELLFALSSIIGAAVSWTTIYKQRRRALPRDPMPEHRALYTAIADALPEAAHAAMAELVRLAQEDTRQS